MKKEDILSLMIYMVMIAVAIIVGLTVVRDAFTTHYNLNLSPYVFAIVVILGGLLLNVIMLEVGHVIGAKLGKYAILSFNVLGFCWQKKAGKWKFQFKDFDGLTGETKVAPKNEKSKLTPYIWFPVLFYALELVGCIVVYTMASDKNLVYTSPLHWMAIAAIFLIIISSMIALYNLTPFKLDSMNDGYRLILLSKKENIEAYNELMRIEAAQMNNEDVGEIKVFSQITEFTASINLISVYEELHKGNFAKAEELIDMIVVDPAKVSALTYNRLLAQKLYIKIMTLPLEEVRKYYDENINDNARKFIANDLSMESLRAYILIAGLLDDSNGEVEFAKSRLHKALKRTLASRVKIEEQLFNEALEKVYSSHPEWKNEVK